jgi:hypothetical protein
MIRELTSTVLYKSDTGLRRKVEMGPVRWDSGGRDKQNTEAGMQGFHPYNPGKARGPLHPTKGIILALGVIASRLIRKWCQTLA